MSHEKQACHLFVLIDSGQGQERGRKWFVVLDLCLIVLRIEPRCVQVSFHDDVNTCSCHETSAISRAHTHLQEVDKIIRQNISKATVCFLVNCSDRVL